MASLAAAYRATLAQLKTDWESLRDRPDLWRAGPTFALAAWKRLWQCMEHAATLESAARRIFGAKGCPMGRAGCLPDAVYSCDSCAGMLEPPRQTVLV
jgi:hypothetical protein